MKMIKEERELIVWVEANLAMSTGCTITAKRSIRRLAKACRRATYEDAARRVDNLIGSSPAEEQLRKALALWDQQWVCRIVNKMRKEIIEECAKPHSFKDDGAFHGALGKAGFGVLERLKICELADKAIRKG